MDPTLQFVLTVAGLMLLGVVSEFILSKTGIPDGVFMVLVGVVVGPVLGLVKPAFLEPAVPFFGAIALVVLLTSGGLNLNIEDVARNAPRGILLGLLSFFFSIAAVCLYCYFAYRAGVIRASNPMVWIMSGAIVGGTSSLVIFPTLARIKNVDPQVTRLLEIESSATDALCIVVVLVLIDAVTSPSPDVLSGFVALGKQLGFGALAGTLLGMALVPLMPIMLFKRHTYTFILSLGLLLYVVTSHSGGNGPLAVLVYAILIGNTSIIMKRLAPSAVEYRVLKDETTLAVQEQISFFIKAFFFTVIGLMFPLDLRVILTAATVVLLMLLFRVLAVGLASLGSKIKAEQRALLIFGMPRGIAAGVLASLPAYHRIEHTDRLAQGVFAIIALSILAFALGFGIFRPKSPVEASSSSVEGTGNNTEQP